ncbi:sodium:proton antiporter [Nocardioides sp. BGMRC 2183]|nr:sodium:proton antiporter [Nocardioides sp. BGMRC 2183]
MIWKSLRSSGRPRPPEQLTRNWNELLQELRVMQTGVQILTGFLLTVPFSDRFDDLAQHQRYIYLGVLAGAVLTTLLIVAPVSFHRVLFRQRQRGWLVAAGHLCARAGLLCFGLVSAGVVLLVFDVVIGTTAGLIAGAVVVLAFASLWYGVPRLVDDANDDEE